MNVIEIKLLETGISIVLFFLIRILTHKLIDKTVNRSLMQKTRGKIIKKIFQLILLIITLAFILTVWGVDETELFTIMASVLTVIGIALFAQWSHLSNITSGVIIFFNHSVKLDDTISIIDKDFEVKGKGEVDMYFVSKN